MWWGVQRESMAVCYFARCNRRGRGPSGRTRASRLSCDPLLLAPSAQGFCREGDAERESGLGERGALAALELSGVPCGFCGHRLALSGARSPATHLQRVTVVRVRARALLLSAVAAARLAPRNAPVLRALRSMLKAPAQVVARCRDRSSPPEAVVVARFAKSPSMRMPSRSAPPLSPVSTSCPSPAPKSCAGGTIDVLTSAFPHALRGELECIRRNGRLQRESDRYGIKSLATRKTAAARNRQRHC